MLRDTWIVFRRQARLSLRNPVWLLLGAIQPLLYLFLFGPLLTPLASALGTANALLLLVPGLLVQLGVFGTLFAGFGLVGEWRDGVVEAKRVTPAHRAALLVGRVLRDLSMLLLQLLLLVGAAALIGLRAPLAGVALGLGLSLLLGAAFSAVSYALGLLTRSEDTLSSIVNGLSLPVLLLSGILLPMSLGPEWLQRLSDLLPTKHIVAAVRAAFAGGSDVWLGTVLAVALALVCVAWGTRVFARENA